MNDTFYGEGIEWGGRRVGVGHGVFNEICPTFCLYPYFSQEIQHLDRRLHPKPKEKSDIVLSIANLEIRARAKGGH